jgi:hypothetical protein
MQDDSSSSVTVIPKTFALNFCAFVLFGALLLGWCYRYTDWIAVVGGFLTLAGMLSWLAFILKIIPEKRMGEFQAWADETIFNNVRAKWLVLSLLVIGLVAGSFLGTVEVTWPAGEGSRSVWMHRLGTSRGEAVALAPGGVARRWFFTTLWSKPTTVRVKVNGFPDLMGEIKPWQRYEIRVPDSFYRPVVLLRPSVDLLNMLRNEPMRLSVTVDSQSWIIPTYDGQSLWIGCDSDVEVPEAKREVWRGILAASGQPETARYWVYPLTLGSPIPELHSGQTIEVTLLREDRSPYTSRKFAVLPAAERQAFPQEENLDVPSH